MLLVMLIAVPYTAQAGTNLPALKDYPAPDCAKPGDKPMMAKDAPKVVEAGGVSITTSARDVKGYNERVGAYNATFAAYTRCMDAYVDNAQADMNAIRDKVNQAVTAGKAP
ncbi:MAG TPA: hypothetical protein VGI89_05225 [Rhizomicrobium sp.]